MCWEENECQSVLKCVSWIWRCCFSVWRQISLANNEICTHGNLISLGGACQLSHTHTTLLVNMERHSHPFWQTYQQARMLCAEVASVAMCGYVGISYEQAMTRVYMQWYLWEDIIWVSVRWCWGLSYFLSLNWRVCFVTAIPASALCRACVSVPCWHISCPCSPTKGYCLSHLHQQVTASEFQAWEELPQTHLLGN